MLLEDYEIIKEISYYGYLISFLYDKVSKQPLTLVSRGAKSLCPKYLKSSFCLDNKDNIKAFATFRGTNEGWEDALNYVISKALKEVD